MNIIFLCPNGSEPTKTGWIMFFNLLFMEYYQILLEDRQSGRKAHIECPANMVLETLSIKIKLALRLPYCDEGWHRFKSSGKTYVIWEHLQAEPEILWEATGRYPYGYRSSECVKLRKLFTVKGSAITYLQDEADSWNDHKVCCTLMGRTSDDK